MSAGKNSPYTGNYDNVIIKVMAKKTAPPKKISLPTQKDPPKIRNWAGIIYTITSAIIIICGTYIAIRWANGDFRLDRSADVNQDRKSVV